MYGILRAGDRRFDGRLFVGVRSTKIYCRPICTVRPPKIENCTFYPTAAAAEHAGYRPCLKCRPELAPGTSAPVDAMSRLAVLAIRRIEDGAMSRFSLDEIAGELGVSSRHLRRAVQQECRISPVALAQTQRLLSAKQFLTDTRMSVTDVAFAAGFKSLRRFNTAFKNQYRLTPSALRRKGLPAASIGDAFEFQFGVRPPFEFAALREFWKSRCTAGVEAVTRDSYVRTVRIGRKSGWLLLADGPRPHTVAVTVSASLAMCLPTVLARVRTMLDLRADATEIGVHLSADPILAPLLRRWPAVQIPAAFDGFECGIRAILGQQISVQAASTLSARLANRFGEPIATTHESLKSIFPAPAAIAAATVTELKSLGLTTRRAETVRAFSAAVADGWLRIEPGVDPDKLRSALLEIPGIGPWTAEYILLRGIGWPDAFPNGDLGLVKAAGLTASQLQNRAEAWRPWRGHAAILLWRSLGDH